MTTFYYKRYWDETTGDEFTDSWGTSKYYFETDSSFFVLRQIQIFENGQILKYEKEYLEDKYGGLSEIPLDDYEFKEFQIKKDEFEQMWQSSYYKKFPEIVSTHHTLWGQPRLDGRRLVVGDIISMVDLEDIKVIMEDFDLTLLEIRQALHYCKDLECKRDKPEKYCHNCILRVEQFNETIDKEDPEQPNWLRADKLYEKYFKT
jgi:uncharacterized protein (DUF433 family)